MTAVIWAVVLAVYLVGGYFWTRWFIGSVLDDGKWQDTQRPANPLLVHVMFPVMAVVIGSYWVCWKIGNTTGKGKIRRLYRLDDR